MNTDCASSVGRSFSARFMRFTCFSTALRNCSSFIPYLRFYHEEHEVREERQKLLKNKACLVNECQYNHVNSLRALRGLRGEMIFSRCGSAPPHLPEAAEHFLFEAMQAFPDRPQFLLFLEQLFQQPLADALVIRIVQEAP